MEINLIISIVCVAASVALFLAYAISSARKLKRIKGELEAKSSLDAERLKRIEELCISVQRALVLAQSKDAESRKALIDLLTEKKPELKKEAEPVKERIEKKEKARKEVLEKVSKPYAPVD